MTMKRESEVLFADIAVKTIEPKQTLPSKFERMLKKAIPKNIRGKKAVIKMHLGGGVGYTTIHPVFVRILVRELKTAGAGSVKVVDVNAAEGVARGYTPEVLGCPVVSCLGRTGQNFYRKTIGFKTLDEIVLSGEALDSDFFIDLSHVKGHGDCGFGGAIKNIAMGLVDDETRSKIHRLEGGLIIDRKKCSFCRKCLDNCPREAIIADEAKKEISIFFHHCTYCRHCTMVCPKGAITMENRKFEDFSKGLALTATMFLKTFQPKKLLFINFLTNITAYCDCWGLSTASLVPDIGILCSENIAAIEKASLDMIKTENLLPGGLPKNRKLINKNGHLFEKIHGKDPYLVIKHFQDAYGITSDYEIKEVE